MIKTINSNKAPKAIGPYSQAIIANGFIFCSGQIGIDPRSNKMKEGIEAQTKQVMLNIKSVLEAAGTSVNNIVKTNIYLKKMANYQTVNEIYEQELNGHKPARATVEVRSLPMGALIEIDCIAQSLL